MDDFDRYFDIKYNDQLVLGGKITRNRKTGLIRIEIMTILIVHCFFNYNFSDWRIRVNTVLSDRIHCVENRYLKIVGTNVAALISARK